MAGSAENAPETAHPDSACMLCPRLAEFRTANREQYPDFFNAPVPSFGDPAARLLIVGLAPGLKGANCTGRPFTGDYAGDLLYSTLTEFGFARGRYDRRSDDGLRLIDCRITNAVRCVPPQNKPLGAEVRTCARFLRAEMRSMPNLAALLCLGALSHGAVLATLGVKKSAYRFAHGARHHPEKGLLLADSYHCSRYNTNTRRLTEDMFRQVIAMLRDHLDGAPPE
jgi:uracil-DNA glycosylase family 4